MKTIAIIAQKGGSGKTTLALHLAVAAQQSGQRAIVIDLDPQASATLWHKARQDKQPHVQPTHPAALETLLAETQKQGFDFAIIDTAPQADTPAVSAAEHADLVLIPCRPSVMDLRAMQNTLRLCALANVKPYVVLTQIEPLGTLHEEARRTLKALQADVLPCGLGRRVAYHHGLIDGRTAQEYEPSGKAAQEVSILYKHLCHLAIKTIRGLEVFPSSHLKVAND